MGSYRRTVAVLVVALLMPIVPFVVIGELPGAQWLSARDASAPLFALTGAGLLVADVLLPVPSSVVITLLGARLGLLEGWLAAWLGLSLGNLLGYALGRLWPARWAPEIPDQPTVLLLLVSRPVPILAEALTLAAGAGRARLGSAMAACVVGNGVYTLVLAGNGAALIGAGFTGFGLVVPMLVPVVGWIVWRAVRRRDDDDVGTGQGQK